MPDALLTNQIKSLDDACRQLQRRMGDDTKARDLLHSMRTLLTRHVLDGTLGPELFADALVQYRVLKPAIYRLIGETSRNLPPESQEDMRSLLHAAHAQLTAAGTTEAKALCQRIVKLEADYVETFEAAFRRELTATASPQTADSASGYDRLALAEFLATTAFSSRVSVKSIEVIAGGFSKLTLGAQLEGDSDIPVRIVLRCDLPTGKAFTGTAVKDEYRKLQVAYRHGVRVPQPYAIEESGSVIGMPFIALSHAAGRTVGTLFEFPPTDPDLGRDIARQLALIHTIPLNALGPEIMGPSVATMDRIRSEIDKSHAVWKTLNQPSSIIEEGFRRLYQDIALADGRRTLVHGDIGLHNMMVENNRITAMLDWEYCKLGNPADDLGYFYFAAAYLVDWDEFMAEYMRAGGSAPPRAQIDYYCLLGLIRICVLCHQSHAAFLSGTYPQIEYAIPYNLLLRGTLLRAAKLLERFSSR